MRETWPLTIPLRVSTSAYWPMRMSLVCVSAMRSSAFRSDGLATRARLLPGADLTIRARVRRRIAADALEHAVHACLDLQIVELLAPQLPRRLLLIDVRFLRRDLRLDAQRE